MTPSLHNPKAERVRKFEKVTWERRTYSIRMAVN